MFRTKRSGLVRRLWRSRLVPDGYGGEDLLGTNPEKIPKTDFTPMSPDGGTGSPRSERRTLTCCVFQEAARGRDTNSCRFSVRNTATESPKPPVEQELKSATYSLLKKLKEKALDSLLEAVESGGGMPSDCVTVPRTGAHPPQLLVCRLYRWPDLQNTTQIKSLCDCKSFGTQDGPVVCCNPYHYSRLCGPGKSCSANVLY